MKKGMKYFIAVFVVSVALLISGGQANAQLTYYFGVYSEFGSGAQWGGVAPSGTWASAEFIDVGSNHVRLTLNVTNNLTVENVGEFYFNYAGTASSLSIVAQAGGGSTANIGQQNDFFQADADGLYDLLFDFPPGPGQGSNKFTAGETVIYDITGTGVTAAGFYELAASGGPNGPFYAAVKLQGIDCDEITYSGCAAEGGTTSTWSYGVVPEPVSSTLFLVGAATLGYRRFRKKS